MICKMNFGSAFRGCLDYITGRYDESKQTKILAHSSGIPDLDNKSVAQIFDAYARKGGHSIKNPVAHFAYSFHANDAGRLSDDFMAQIVREHMEMMGIRNTEWIIGRHYDTDHEHCHLMFSMVDNDGKVISDSMIHARNKRVCNYLNKKYGLTMSSEKSKVNRDRLRGKEKVRYDFYDKVMGCRNRSSTWKEFDEALKAAGVKMRFHYNNVNRKLMGVAFTDGRYSFSGRQLDEELKIRSLVNYFGDLQEFAHDGARCWYENYQKDHTFRNVYGEAMPFPEFDKIFPNAKNPTFNYLDVPSLLSVYNDESRKRLADEYTCSGDGKSSYISLLMLFNLLLLPYIYNISTGGGITNNTGWRDKKDDDNEHEPCIIVKPAVKKPKIKKSR